MFVLLHKWGGTAATTDSTLGAFCSLQGVKIKPKPIQTVVFAFAKGSHLNLKRKCQDYPKIRDLGVLPWLVFELFSYFKCRGTLQEGSSDVGEGEVVPNHVSCAFCRNWEISKGAREGCARPRSPTDSKLKTCHKNPGKGFGRGNSGGVCWRHSWGPGHHCWHWCNHLLWKNGFLPGVVWLWPGVLPKALGCFSIQ